MNLYIEKLEAKKHELITRVRAHSFLRRCRAGQVGLKELKLFLVQQGLYSSHFTRYLCALMANLPGNQEILELADNLFEELGLSDADELPHHLLYKQMLGHFGILTIQADPYAGTAWLIRDMLDHCKQSNPAYGLGALCLGAEALVPSMYADIIEGFLAQGVELAELEFFRIHVACDDGHAETIRDLMVAMAEENPAQLDIMLQAGEALVNSRLRFFSDIEAMAHAVQAVHQAAPAHAA
ncbi:hypothetical protein GJ700_20480 [Duganella sp. FT92W]|uniref:Iron-containing redox enzyme family protein n=1 Tax=Pseudoduganella rivuli TaxID=2666085 RepID=A0A7X2IQF8_9BURK|nr:iron-containing redox enzyme family protein [Pseudoduganella rivuli]MRV74089.1 hypothetical protein [Pseudoduganella rivuli]